MRFGQSLHLHQAAWTRDGRHIIAGRTEYETEVLFGLPVGNQVAPRRP